VRALARYFGAPEGSLDALSRAILAHLRGARSDGTFAPFNDEDDGDEEELAEEEAAEAAERARRDAAHSAGSGRGSGASARAPAG
jgi:hypothetical protein